MSLKQQAVSGVLWTFVQQFGTQIINFIVSIVLARLLLPKDFGTLAIMDIFMAIGTVIISSGMTTSLIRTKDANDEDYSTVFYFNIVISIFLYLIAFASAPLLASFYETPELTSLTRVYCISFIIGAFTSVQRTIFTKNMEFKKQTIIEIPSLFISGIVGIGMAYKGFGIWSLLGSSLSLQLANSIQYWLYSKWRPLLLFNKNKFKEHFGFGSNLLFSGLTEVVFSNIYTIIIGKQFSMNDLGYYNRANSLRNLPVLNISTALNKVSFPMFAKMENDEMLKNAYEKLLQIVLFIVAPLMVSILIFAEPIIRVLLTEKWIETVPYLQILAVASILYPIHAYNLNILNVKGRSDLFFKLNLLRKFITVITILITIKFGIIGLAWGQVVNSITSLFINSYFSGKFINLSLVRQFSLITPILIITTITGLLIFYLKNHLLLFNDFSVLLLGISAFSLIYIGLSKLFVPSILIELFSLIKTLGRNETH